MTTRPKNLRDEILHILGRASQPMNTGEIYERCQLTDKIKRVVDAVYTLRIEGRIERIDAPGRATYRMPAKATQTASADSVPVLPEVPVVDRTPAPTPHIPTFLRKDAPAQALPVPPAPAIKSISDDSALTDQFVDADNMIEAAVSYSINDSGNLCIADDDTFMLLPANEVKRLVKFLDRVAGLL